MKNAISKIRVVIVDDHPIMCDGLSARIDEHAGWEVCGVAATEDDGFALIIAECPDLVLAYISLKLGNGIELIKRVRERMAFQAMLENV